MKKQILKTLFLLTSTFFSLNTFAESGEIIEVSNADLNRVDYSLSIENEVLKELKKEISINTKYEVNLEELEQKLKIIYPEKNFRATWEIKGGTASNQEGFKFERTFKEKGIKEVELVIYEISNLIDSNNNPFKEEKSIYTKDFEILVFEKIIPIILSSKVKEEEYNSYVEYSKKDGILIYKIGPFENSEIELANLTNEIDKYSKIPGLKFDYLTIWGDRDFIFDILSKINRELTNTQDYPKLNIVAISPYNINVLKNYLKNFLTNKTWLNKIIITNENSKFFILKEDSIKSLETELQTNKYEYLDVSLNNSGINKALFLSNFINTLSNLGFSTNNIYIFLIIPIILLIITFFKHFIGISPIGIAIPTFLTILFFKLGFFVTLFLIFAYLIVNFSISVITSRYNLLYVPKMTFILTLNIILLVVLINIGYSFNLLSLDLNDTIYFVIFLLISEKIVNILLSKDLIEYKGPFFYTLIISIVAFLILSIGGIKILILAYPEFLVFLIPINFIMGRFTGLRMTEYIRFKEVIKNIEE